MLSTKVTSLCKDLASEWNRQKCKLKSVSTNHFNNVSVSYISIEFWGYWSNF